MDSAASTLASFCVLIPLGYGKGEAAQVWRDQSGF
jgi:hypothetical protein